VTYTAYFDESGTHAGSHALVVSGYIASDEQWAAFDHLWNEALADEGLTHFHMKDFAHSRNEFKDWKGDEERRVAFLRRLIEIIRGNTRTSVSSAVRLQDYERLNRAYRLRESYSPYSICVLGCLASVSRWHTRHGYIEPVSLVLEDGVNERKEFQRFYSPTNFHTVAFAKKRDHAGLQAADFVAWEHLKAYNQFESGAFKRYRNSFRALYSMPYDWGILTANELERFCKGFEVPSRIERPGPGS
jgi:hypothetical protein